MSSPSPLAPTMAERKQARAEWEQTHPKNPLAGCVASVETRHFGDDRRGNPQPSMEVTTWTRKDHPAIVAQQYGDGMIEFTQPSGEPNTRVGKSTKPFPRLFSRSRPSAGTPNQTVVEAWVEPTRNGRPLIGKQPAADTPTADTQQLQAQVAWLMAKVAEQSTPVEPPAVAEVAPVKAAPVPRARKRRRR